jgi:hypothetical protein
MVFKTCVQHARLRIRIVALSFIQFQNINTHVTERSVELSPLGAAQAASHTFSNRRLKSLPTAELEVLRRISKSILSCSELARRSRMSGCLTAASMAVRLPEGRRVELAMVGRDSIRAWKG